MTSIGTELARLYSEISSDRAERAQAAMDRSSRVAAIVDDTQTLLQECHAKREEMSKAVKRDAAALHDQLSRAMGELRTSMVEFRNEANADAQIRQSDRETSARELRAQLSRFHDSLVRDTQDLVAAMRHARTFSGETSTRLETAVAETGRFVEELRGAATSDLAVARHGDSSEAAAQAGSSAKEASVAVDTPSPEKAAPGSDTTTAAKTTDAKTTDAKSGSNASSSAAKGRSGSAKSPSRK